MNSNRDTFNRDGTNQRISNSLLATVRYVPLLTGLLALALLAAYALSTTGLLGNAAGQLLTAALITGLVGLAHLPIVDLTRKGRGGLAYFLFALVLGIWSLSLVLLWESVALVTILIAWIAPLAGLAAGLRRRHVVAAAGFGVLCTTSIILMDANPWLQRLVGDSPAGLAAVVLLASTIVLFVLGTIIVRLVRYKSLQGRLVLSFVLIITIPILFTTAISAITAFNNSQNQFSDSLHAVSALKQGQIDSTAQAIALEMSGLQQGNGKASILRVLDRTGESDETYRLNASVASTLMRDLIVQFPASHYEEVLVLDSKGSVALSTYKPDEGSDFANESFFTLAPKKFFAEMIKFPGKLNTVQEYKFVAASPFYGSSPDDLRGVLLVVAKSDVIFNIMGPTAGLANARTYLVGVDRKVIADAGTSEPVVSALPILHLVYSKIGEGINNYVNHEGLSVLGYSIWDPTINAAIVAEIPRSDVFNKSLSTLFVSGLVGLFTIVIAVIAALSTSRAISDPVRTLATAAKALANGDLTARAATDQQDEIGNLAISFNTMADQLQSVISNLEQRVAERTEALEQQTLRLRAAAEVARDAASAPSLDELLEQAARLIRDRFSLYHTGIFLLDDKREYAVLQASPSEGGKSMLENKHRLRVGEQGIVGHVASTGGPRIALDTGVDPVYFSNPWLPATHSEMALPLKTAEGIIGVIDIQSDQPEAFTQDDIAIVQVMADQLATAIQRIRLLQQVQTQLTQLEHSHENFTEQSWRIFERAGRQNVGYKFDNMRLESMKSVPEEPKPAPDDSEGFVTNGTHATPQNALGQVIEVPIRLRGQTIGIVNLRLQSGGAPEVTVSMIQQIADRLATALENARLLEDSMRRADKERAIGEITTKISASVNMRNVLQTAVEELGRAIPGSDVLIQFQADTEN
jgi:GAF domain-containing protein/HAMP domain-containing protein